MTTTIRRKQAVKASDSSAEVDALMARLEHTHKIEIEALRKVLRDVDPAVLEGVKWNAPSFRTTEYFATTNLRVKGGVGIIFHLGARVREGKVHIDDPEGLLKWLAKDRAMFTFSSLTELRARQAALVNVARQWIKHV